MSQCHNLTILATPAMASGADVATKFAVLVSRQESFVQDATTATNLDGVAFNYRETVVGSACVVQIKRRMPIK